MTLFLCVSCSPKYEDLVRLVPGSSLHRSACADCGKLRDGYDYYTGAKPPKPQKPVNPFRLGRRGHG